MPAAYDIAPKPDMSFVQISHNGKILGSLSIEHLSAGTVQGLCKRAGHEITFSQAAMICQSILADQSAGKIIYKGTPLVEEKEVSIESVTSAPSVVALLERICEQLENDPRINAIAYTKKQTAQILNVSERTIDRWTQLKHDPLPRIRNGQKFLYRREALIDWLKRHEKTN